MRKKIVAGNWKMNKNFSEAENLMKELLDDQKNHPSHCEVYIAPPSLYLTMGEQLLGQSSVKVFAQDISEFSSGAYTGEISAEMLKSINIAGSLVAHSERRQYHNETNEKAAKKVKALLNLGLTPIYCNGETLEQRKSGAHFDVVREQTVVALFSLSEEEIKRVIIAYEPVWAIGTGETATPEQAQEIHAFIRETIAEKYGKETADEISILYGGSVKPDNAKEIFSQSDIDGGLIGGAALKIEDFSKIIEAYQ